MNSLLLKLLLITWPVSSAGRDPADTTIKGVTITFSYSLSIFPDSWQSAPVSAMGAAIDRSEIDRSKSIMITAMNKYPAAILRTNLRAVYFLRSMEFFRVGYGGTNSSDALYLTDDG